MFLARQVLKKFTVADIRSTPASDSPTVSVASQFILS